MTLRIGFFEILRFSLTPEYPDLLLFPGINGRRASLFCGLRRFTKNNVSNGYRADVRSNLYLTFHLTLSFRDFRDRTVEQKPSNRAMFLVVTAQPVHSAYKGSIVQGLRWGPTDERTRWLQIVGFNYGKTNWWTDDLSKHDFKSQNLLQLTFFPLKDFFSTKN